jgi:hypothetical protein
MMRTSMRVEGAEMCFMAGLEECSGPVVNSICEGHLWKLFRLAWR